MSENLLIFNSIAKTAAELGFQWYDRRRLQKALRQVEDARTYRRLQAVLLITQGRDLQEVAQIVGTTRQSLYNWLPLYLQEHTTTALVEAPRSGPPRSAKALTAPRLRRELKRDPLARGYNTTRWTVPVLATPLSQRFACQLSSPTLRRRLKQLGRRWKRPRYSRPRKSRIERSKKGNYPALKADGILLFVQFEVIEALPANLLRVAIHILLDVKDVIANSGQIDMGKDGMNMLVRILRLCFLLLEYLLIIVKFTLKEFHHRFKVSFQIGFFGLRYCADTEHE